MANAEPKIKTTTTVKEPPLYKVIYLNDDKTEVGFVIASLIDHFDYNATTAEQITLDIHNKGSAVVAILPYEIAEQKGIEVTICARAENYPLQIKLEPDTE